jgi:hypothetical protein
MVTASHLLGGQVGSTAPVFLAFLAVHVISGLTAVVTGAPPRWRVRAAPGIRGRAGLNGKRWIGSHQAPGMRCHGALTVGEVYGPGLRRRAGGDGDRCWLVPFHPAGVMPLRGTRWIVMA